MKKNIVILASLLTASFSFASSDLANMAKDVAKSEVKTEATKVIKKVDSANKIEKATEAGKKALSSGKEAVSSAKEATSSIDGATKAYKNVKTATTDTKDAVSEAKKIIE